MSRMTMTVASYLEGDKQDKNHVRVYNHHIWGLTNSGVIIDGVVRDVRATSAQNGRKHREWDATIMLHLKPLPSKTGGRRLQCTDLSTLQLLRRIKRTGQRPTIQEVVFDNPDLNQTPGQRLLWRKLTKLYWSDYITHLDSHRTRWIQSEAKLHLTDKGLRLLEALELAERQDG